MIQLADMTAEEVHYSHRTTVPGSYRTGLIKAYPIRGVDLDVASSIWRSKPDSFLVITGSTPIRRTSVGANWVAQSTDDWRYWTEADYVENQKTLQHYKVMAEKLPGSQDVVDQYHNYERDLLRLESYPNVFFDGIGDTGFWPNEVRPLMTCLQERMRAEVPTAMAIDVGILEKVPEWNRIIESMSSVVIDLDV